MVKKNWLLVLSGVMAILIVGLGFLLKWNIERIGWEKVEEAFPNRGVPRINIALNGVSLDEINEGSKEVKYEGNELTVYDGGDEVVEYGDVRVKGRGNGTWGQEKKPYQIKFDKKVDLFGMGKARKWILLANSMDATNLRTEAAFYLEGILGMEPTFVGEFVELYVDGDYQGLYYLAHVVEIDKQSVDLKDPMGVLVELDNLYWEGERYFESNNGDKLVVKDAKTDYVVDVAMGEFMDDYNAFEKAVMKKDYHKICELIDVESFAKYYLLSEFTVNPDAYWTSFYMYKDGSDDKIHAGPGWDFDLALANRTWGNWLGEEFYSSKNTMIRKREIMTREMYEEMGLVSDEVDWHGVSLRLSHLFFDMVEVPEFWNVVKSVYVERMKGREDELLWRIGQEANRIEEAVMADEERWGGEGFWYEVETMKRWIDERYKYFDEVYGGEKILLGE